MAVRSPTMAFVGRVLFAFLFISSRFQKLTSFNLQNGGPVMGGMAPKMDNFLKTLDHVAGVQLPIHQVSKMPHLLLNQLAVTVNHRKSLRSSSD